MAYHLKENEPVPQALRRLGRERVERAIACLREILTINGSYRPAFELAQHLLASSGALLGDQGDAIARLARRL